jgi:hypothetical protein
MTVNLSALAGAGQQFFDNSGVILSGGKLYSYAAGTSTPQATYTSASGVTAHTNPIVLDSAGRVATGEIWLTAGSNYKFALYTSANVLITTWDNITGINGTGIATDSASVSYTPAGTGAVTTTVQAKLRQYVSVQDFGAKGDNSTDDTLAIQAALNLGPFHAIYFPAGTYIVSNLTCGADITLYGDGLINSILKFKTGSAGAILTANNAVHLTIRNLGFNGNYTNCASGTNCLSITGTESGGNGFWIDESGFFNAKSIGLYQVGTYTKARISNCVAEGNQLDGIITNATNIILEGNRCSSNGRFGILSQGSYAQIFGNTCTSNGQLVTGGAGIGVVSCSFPIVSNNNCISNGTSTYFTHGIQFNGVTNGVMEGNFSQGNNGSGLDIYQSAYATCTGNQTINNKVRGIENDTTSTYSVIDGNVVVANYEIGISVYNTIGSVVSNNIVIGNGTLGTASNPLTGSANLPYGISLWGAGSYANNSMILGNQISQNVGSGSNGVGLWVDASCTDVSLLSNEFAANTTNITSIKANFFVVRDNQGIYTQQSGTASLGSASTSVAVTFSPALTYAPTASGIKLMYISQPFSNTGPFAISSISTSGFTISTYTAPGGSGATIDWSVSVFP